MLFLQTTHHLLQKHQSNHFQRYQLYLMRFFQSESKLFRKIKAREGTKVSTMRTVGNWPSHFPEQPIATSMLFDDLSLSLTQPRGVYGGSPTNTGRASSTVLEEHVVHYTLTSSSAFYSLPGIQTTSFIIYEDSLLYLTSSALVLGRAPTAGALHK
jgi:hypothetical protein